MSTPRRLFLFVGSGTAIAAAVTAVVLTTPVARTAGGTSVGGVDVGGLERSAVRARLSAAVAALPSELTVRLGERSSTVSREELGVSVDVDETVDRVLAKAGTGRFDRLTGSPRGSEVQPVLERDDERLESTSARLAGIGTFPESHGSLRWSGGAFLTTPPASGQTADPAVITSQLVTRAARLSPTPTSASSVIDVPVTVVPAHVTEAQVAQVKDDATAFVAKPVGLSAGPLSTTVAGRDLAPYLTLAATGEGAGHGVALAASLRGTEQVVTAAAGALSRAPRQPELGTPALSKVLLDKGSTSFTPIKASTNLTRSGRAGQEVNAAQVRAVLTAAVAGAQHAASVPATAQPAISDAAMKGVDAILGTFTTKYACCQPRVTNIRTMARRVDGTVIAPGETFSLNTIVGRRTKEKGYVPAPYIFDGELSEDVGGGVSQFATTTFNAAFFAGVRLDAHQAHSFYISRYPPGREATVNYPGIDLRWTNDTGSPVVVRTRTDDTSLTVALFGHGDGRRVSGVTGDRTPVAGRDFRIKVTRTVALPGRPARSQTFTTTYNRSPEH